MKGKRDTVKERNRKRERKDGNGEIDSELEREIVKMRYSER